MLEAIATSYSRVEATATNIRNKKLLVTKGIATSSKKMKEASRFEAIATRVEAIATSSKKSYTPWN